MSRSIIVAAVIAMALATASPAFGQECTGREYGRHISEHARNEGGFTGEHNPGVMHQGFSGFCEHHVH